MDQQIKEGIFQSHDYEKFTFGHNRKISRKNVEMKKASIEEFGQLTPIEVTSSFVITDGQHRFLALKELGLPVIYRYVLFDSINDREVAEINAQVVKWNIKTYVRFYAPFNESYDRLLRLWENFPDLGWQVISLATNLSVKVSVIQRGLLQFSEADCQSSFNLLSQAYDIYSSIKTSRYSSPNYLKAFINLIKYNIFTYEELKFLSSKSDHLWYDLQKPSNIESAVNRIEYAYNFNLPKDQRRYILSDYKKRSLV